MPARLFVIVGLGLLGAGSAFSDVVDVTVNGSVSGSGGVVGICPVFPPNPPPPECNSPGPNPNLYYENFPFSFSGTNSQLGAFDLSGRAGPDPVSIFADANQMSKATSDALEISVGGLYSEASVGGYDVTLNDAIAVSFNLTQESEVELTNCLPLVDPSFSLSSALLDSKGNVILQVQPFGGSPCGGSSVSTVLQPGRYQLDESVMGSAFGGSFSSSQAFGFDLQATFTPVVPEPRWAVLGTVLTLLLAKMLVEKGADPNLR
jgi:hypothetical protein